MIEDKNARAREQAQAQYDSICEMVEALDMDWERLEELRDDRKNYEPEGAQDERWEVTFPEMAQELLDLEGMARDWKDREAVEDAIREGPLSIEVRSGWQRPGETLIPDEFQILLCTGGPAVRIRGELDEHGEPYRAWIEYQDWFTPWEQWSRASQDVLVRYCSNFIFGY